MKKVVSRLKLKGIDLSRMRALEVFAREGNWHAKSYANKVESLDAWEIDSRFKKGLRKNLPKAKIKITDSIKETSIKSNFSKYDFIVVDNPQNCYGPKLKYCEHFEIIPKIAKLLNQEGVLIFDINRKPFNFDNFPLWKKRREKFYGLKNTGKITIKWLLGFYKKLFLKFGYRTRFSFNMLRGTKSKGNYFQYLVFYIKKDD